MANVHIERLKDRDTAEAFIELMDVAKFITYATPTTGATLTAALLQGTFTIVPAADLATLTVILPPTPSDADVFKITTTKNIAALSVQGSGSAIMAGTSGGPIYLSANGSVSWHYRLMNNVWYPS